MTLHLKAHEICFQRPPHLVFDNLSFELSSGELLLVEGANGTGKSTLLKLLSSLIKPHAGDIRWQQHSIFDSTTNYAKELHYVGHTNGIKSGLTVIENINLMQTLSMHACNPAILPLLSLEKHQHSLSRDLSAGQKRRLALAKLFCIKKPLWILDEPLTAIDAETQQLLTSALKTHLLENGMAIISTHQPLLLSDVPVKHIRLSSC